MRSSKRRQWAGAVAVMAATVVLAGPVRAEDLKWSGQLRFRTEGFDRTFQGQKTQWDHFQRTRIGLAMPVADRVHAFVQIQDARVWGVERTTTADLHYLDIHQAYADLNADAAQGEFRARLGRQELVYGDERIVGALGWSNIGRSFDAVQGRWSQGRYTGDVVAARLADGSEIGGQNDDLFLTYHRFTNSAGDRGIEAYAMYRASPGTAFETLLGERHFGTHGRIRVEEEFAYQFGRRGGADLQAFLFTGQLYVKATSQWTVGGACDILSGDDPDDPELQAFDTGRIFHTGHKFYGLMDVAEGLAGRAGLIDPYAMLLGPGARGGKTRLDAHFFQVANSDVPQGAGPVPVGVGEGALGTEVDLTSTLPLRAQTALEAGLALFVPGARLEAAGQSENSYWGYLQALVNF